MKYFLFISLFSYLLYFSMNKHVLNLSDKNYLNYHGAQTIYGYDFCSTKENNFSCASMNNRTIYLHTGPSS
jgi:hypothetical protein